MDSLQALTPVQIRSTKCAGILHGILTEWTTLFYEDKIDESNLQKYCSEGKLKNSSIRSIVWRVLLKILSVNKADWRKNIDESREHYQAYKKSFDLDPRITDNGELDPDISNPLCQVDINPWSKFFANRILREVILKDVVRTYPESKFFQTERIRELMANVLFIYAKCNPQISYRQGMHEILAPLIFILDSDHKSFQSAKADGLLRICKELAFDDIETLKTMNDVNYVEHDLFTMFSRLMELVKSFYLPENELIICDTNQSAAAISFRKHLLHTPFSQDKQSSELQRRLENILDELLMQTDPPLARHLNILQILPQIYGIRWLRLLFAREFQLTDLLLLWDVLLCDQSPNVVIDSIFLALLICIRHLLLQSDYCTCIQYLMSPPINDFPLFMQLVLHLRDPKDITIPNILANDQSKLHPNDQRPSLSHRQKKSPKFNPVSGDDKSSFKQKQRPLGTRALDNILNKLGQQALSAHQISPKEEKHIKCSKKNGQNTHGKSKHRYSHKESGSSDDSLRTLNTAELKRKRSAASSSTHLYESSSEIELMKEQIALLQSRLNDLDVMAQISARRIVACIGNINKWENFDTRQKTMDDLREVADHLMRNAVSEQFIFGFLHPPPADSGSSSTEAFEMASEASSFQHASGTTLLRSRLPSKTLKSTNELVELRFDRKKNF